MKIINHIYDLSIDSFCETDFWETTENKFLLAFGRIMKKVDLSIDSFDEILTHYNKQSYCENIDKLILSYIEDNASVFIRDELGVLRPQTKNGLHYSSYWEIMYK